ncbi:hypothetical protein BJY24_005356 [Nocardia transvalensis]|uniref:Uncharacterized protein n=1 Tax=Nocardia transvalensis TaxID=37333 RepID=A0A7W9UKG1_9NOCA|nr:hypothetical protein [Nocardia transvalensis]
MTVRSNTPTPASGEDDEAPDDAVVWPEPSPLTSWWQTVMQDSTDRRRPPRGAV